MDRKTIIAFILIGLILVFTQTPLYKNKILGVKEIDKIVAPVDSSSIKSDFADTLARHQKTEIKELVEKKVEQPKAKHELGKGSGEDVIVVTDNYSAVISTKGAIIKSWELKKYYYDKENKIPVQLIKNDGYGNLGVILPFNADTLFTQDIIFKANKSKVILSNEKTVDKIEFELYLDENQVLRKIYTFYHDKYSIDFKLEFENLKEKFGDEKYTLTWLSGLHYTEKNIKEDMQNSKAYIFTGGDKEELNLSEKINDTKSTKNIEGKIDWVAICTKYFISAILPITDDDISVRLTGINTQYDTKLVSKNYSAYMQLKLPDQENNKYEQNFQIYIGPLDYSIIKKYHSGFDKIMGYGPAIIRPFSKLTIAVFKFLHRFIPNYGVVLIVFSILVKIVVYPLTRKSYVSMREMQKLQPMMNDLKEKYGKDPQRINKEMMKLYKEHGVNPLSGCIPTLLQMPLLWSIFLVFRNTIQLRQAPFVLWINDLSSPDTILLPFTLPFIGNALHIIPLFMGATMFFQQKMTMKDPKQKAMVYFMPIFLTFIFYSFPSGLNLYYTLFNLFSMIQQKITPEKHDSDSSTQQALNLKLKKASKK